MLPCNRLSTFTLLESRKALDAFIDIAVDPNYGAGIDPAAIDFQKMNSYVEGLEQFDTFDGQINGPISVWEAWSLVLGPLRAEPIQRGSILSFQRDEPQQVRKHHFTRRQIVAGTSAVEISLDRGQGSASVRSEFSVGGDPRRRGEASAEYGPIPLASTLVNFEGVTDFEHAELLARWTAASNFYRCETRTFRVEMQHRSIAPGDRVGVDTWWLEDGIVVGLLEQIGGGTYRYRVDSDIVWPDAAPSQPYSYIIDRQGREFGPMFTTINATERWIEFLPADAALAQTAAGMTLAQALQPDDGGLPTHCRIGSLAEVTEDWIVRAVRPTDSLHADITVVNDADEVWEAIGEDPGTPPLVTAIADPNPPIPTVRWVQAVIQQVNNQLLLRFACEAARGAVNYEWEILRGAGGTWAALGFGPSNSGEVAIEHQEGVEHRVRVRGHGRFGTPGAWATSAALTTQPLTIYIDDMKFDDGSVSVAEYLNRIGIIEPDSITADMLDNAFRLRLSDDQLELHNNQLMSTLAVEASLQRQKELQDRASAALRADVALGLNPLGSGIDRLDQAVADLQAASATTTTAIYAAIAGVSAEVNTEETARVDAVSAVTTQLNTAVSQLGTDIAGVESKVETLVTENELRSTDSRQLFVQDVEIGNEALMADFLEAVKRGTLDDEMKRRTNLAFAGISRLDDVSIKNGEAIAQTTTVLTAQIAGANASILAESQARATALAATASQISSLTSSLGTTNANLTTEIQTRANADTAFAGQLTTLTASLGTTNASLSTEISTRATADTALSNQITTLTASLGTTNANVSNETTARVNADNALAGQITSLTATVGSVNASLSNEITARANGDSALAGSLTTIQANADLASAFGQYGMSVLAGQDGAVATYQIKLLAGAYNGGMRIDAMSGGGVRAVFDVGSFLIKHPGVNGGAPVPMFAVGSGGVFVNGGMRIDGNLVVNGSIKTNGVEIGAITQSASSVSGGTITGVVIGVRDGAKISITGVFNGLPGTYFPLGTPNGDVRILRNGAYIGGTPTSFEASGTSSPGIAFTSTSVIANDVPGAGVHTYQIQATNGGGIGGVAILVQELAR